MLRVMLLRCSVLCTVITLGPWISLNHFLWVIHQCSGFRFWPWAGCSLSLNNFRHLSLRFWNLPEAALEVVTFKLVYLFSFTLSSPFRPLGRDTIEKPTGSGYLHSVFQTRWESRTFYYWSKERQITVNKASSANPERVAFMCTQTLKFKLQRLRFVLGGEFIERICKCSCVFVGDILNLERLTAAVAIQTQFSLLQMLPGWLLMLVFLEID